MQGWGELKILRYAGDFIWVDSTQSIIILEALLLMMMAGSEDLRFLKESGRGGNDGKVVLIVMILQHREG